MQGVQGQSMGGAKTPNALQPKKKNHIKKKQRCNEFNKDFKIGPHQNKKIFKKKKVTEINPVPSLTIDLRD